MKPFVPILAVLVAAMGPARQAPPPEPPPVAADEDPGRSDDAAARATPAPADDRPALRVLAAGASVPEDFLWTARPVVVFADTPDDPAFREQVRAIEARPEALAERDVVVILDSDPAGNSSWRQQLHPRGFSLVIIDKDGQVKQRRPLPWDVREISRAIDRLPLRRQEIGRAGMLP